MTVTGAGGVIFQSLAFSKRFEKQYKKLPTEIKEKMSGVFADLLKNPRPPGLRFEKLKGYSKPDIYTLHITGNYKLSFEIIGSIANLRCVGNHDEIDRQP